MFLEPHGKQDKTFKRQAGVFFHAFKQLDEDEINFIADKYLNTTHGVVTRYKSEDYDHYKPLTDSVASTHKGLSLSEYSKRRSKIEQKLWQAILQINEAFPEEQINACDVFYLSLGCLYLESYEADVIGRVAGCSFTDDLIKAKKFNRCDDIGDKVAKELSLEKIGLEQALLEAS